MGVFDFLLAPAGEPEGRWVTLRGGRRVKLDADGRLVAGVPKDAIGVHVRDLGPFMRKWRELRAVDCEHQGECATRCPLAFPSKDVAVKVLLEANPPLRDFLEREADRNDREFMAWHRRGRKGKKPERAKGDGRFDTVNERFDLHGPRAVSSWIEALYVTLPASRRWRDLPERLEVLSEATGLSLLLPPHMERERARSADVEACEQWVDQQIDELCREGRSGRLLPADDGVPF